MSWLLLVKTFEKPFLIILASVITRFLLFYDPRPEVIVDELIVDCDTYLHTYNYEYACMQYAVSSYIMLHPLKLTFFL